MGSPKGKVVLQTLPVSFHDGWEGISRAPKVCMEEALEVCSSLGAEGNGPLVAEQWFETLPGLSAWFGGSGNSRRQRTIGGTRFATTCPPIFQPFVYLRSCNLKVNNILPIICVCLFQVSPFRGCF